MACLCFKHRRSLTAWMNLQPVWEAYWDAMWIRAATEHELQGAGLASIDSATNEMIKVYKDEQRAHQSLCLTLSDWLATPDEAKDTPCAPGQ